MNKFLVLALPALTLAGCNSYRGLDPLHQPVVSQSNLAFDVGIYNGRLAPGEARRLSGWLDSIQLGFGDQVTVIDPNPNDAGVRADIASQTAPYGLLLSEAPTLPAAPVAPGTARIVISRATASVSGCPDYTGEQVPNFDAHTSPNFGCAASRNLAAMIADPEDLVRGQTNSRNDPVTGTKAIETYRKASGNGAGGK